MPHNAADKRGDAVVMPEATAIPASKLLYRRQKSWGVKVFMYWGLCGCPVNSTLKIQQAIREMHQAPEVAQKEPPLLAGASEVHKR